MTGSIYRICRYYQIQRELNRALGYEEMSDYKLGIDKEIDEILLQMYDEAVTAAPESVQGIDRDSLIGREHKPYPEMEHPSLIESRFCCFGYQVSYGLCVDAKTD